MKFIDYFPRQKFDLAPIITPAYPAMYVYPSLCVVSAATPSLFSVLEQLTALIQISGLSSSIDDS